MINRKKISKSGGITIPAALRREFGISAGERVNVEMAANGSIVLKRVGGNCILCGGYEGLKVFNKRFICKNCLEKIKGL